MCRFAWLLVCSVLTTILPLSVMTTAGLADPSEDLQIAQETKKKRLYSQEPRTFSGRRIVDQREDVVYRDSSEYHRQNKRFSLVAEVIGFAPLPGQGIAAGYYLNPDSLIEFSYFKSELDAGFFSLGSSMTELRLKQWFGNSFYLNGGVSSQTYTGEATLEPLTGNDEISASVEVQNFGLGIAIGNRWQWEYFSIGCDWVGYFVPLGGGSAKVSGSNEATAAERQESEEDASDLAGEASGMLLRFYLGASF